MYRSIKVHRSERRTSRMDLYKLPVASAVFLSGMFNFLDVEGIVEFYMAAEKSYRFYGAAEYEETDEAREVNICLEVSFPIEDVPYLVQALKDREPYMVKPGDLIYRERLTE
jgi:hypothetical protein